jgi:alkylation response protein AidB-like acyl-CoA dehydrogenase
VNFSFDDQQREFAATLRRALEERAPLARWLQPMEADPAWQLITADLQAAAPDLSEDAGGLGLSIVELAITAEELGRVVAPAEFVAGAFAQGLLAAGGDATRAELRASAHGGRFVLAADPSGGWRDLALDAAGDLTGSFVAPIGARTADAMVGIATSVDGTAVLAVADISGATVLPLDGIDPTAGSARADLDRHPATVYEIPELDDAVAYARRRARLTVAAQALGGARACLALTTLYATQREQFGAPIGSFQAVKHRLADLFVETELAASAVYLAACEPDPATAERATDSAYDVATATYRRAAGDCIQLHGGIGFTWEHVAHLHLERSSLLAVLAPGRSRADRYELPLAPVDA